MQDARLTAQAMRIVGIRKLWRSLQFTESLKASDEFREWQKLQLVAHRDSGLRRHDCQAIGKTQRNTDTGTLVVKSLERSIAFTVFLDTDSEIFLSPPDRSMAKPAGTSSQSGNRRGFPA